MQLRIYQEVIDDVIAGVREHFLEDHIDEHVLQELKQTWEAKLHASKAIQNHQNDEKGTTTSMKKLLAWC